jgi:hypothetical protein
MFHGIIPGPRKNQLRLVLRILIRFRGSFYAASHLRMTMAALMATPDGHFTLSHGLVSTNLF